jgi:hypothetical protein
MSTPTEKRSRSPLPFAVYPRQVILDNSTKFFDYWADSQWLKCQDREASEDEGELSPLNVDEQRNAIYEGLNHQLTTDEAKQIEEELARGRHGLRILTAVRLRKAQEFLTQPEVDKIDDYEEFAKELEKQLKRPIPPPGRSNHAATLLLFAKLGSKAAEQMMLAQLESETLRQNYGMKSATDVVEIVLPSVWQRTYLALQAGGVEDRTLAGAQMLAYDILHHRMEELKSKSGDSNIPLPINGNIAATRKTSAMPSTIIEIAASEEDRAIRKAMMNENWRTKVQQDKAYKVARTTLSMRYIEDVDKQTNKPYAFKGLVASTPLAKPTAEAQYFDHTLCGEANLWNLIEGLHRLAGDFDFAPPAWVMSG